MLLFSVFKVSTVQTSELPGTQIYFDVPPSQGSKRTNTTSKSQKSAWQSSFKDDSY
jgi:hypothetical protein